MTCGSHSRDRWNTWMPQSQVLALNDENEALRMKLRRESALTNSQGAKEKTTMSEVSVCHMTRQEDGH